ncbi:hemicentin-1 isoform X2 [Thrips palmi]|uniref:Hemicentin-1 isoform X2 n=1 Tax=Thrips palmi TaxID=161013 RepID=A0A6P9A194_THRPL|nr:hemicentin-1 isoform X2 [Thrips palmi]
MLPCHVDTASCGTVHSVKWYRGSSRIYVFSEMAVVDHAEGDYVDRADLHYKANATMMHLSVKNLAVVDEATYKCEITYNEVKDGCSVVQFINLTTMIKPEYVKITREGNELQNATLIGPFSEGDDLALTCESGGGKPTPTVAWYNGTAKLGGDYTTEPGSNGAGTGRNSVRLALTRGDLGAKYECRATNDALELPMIASVEVDVNVRPLALELTGVDQHVVQGSSVTLQCVVSGARPSATVTWYNGTEPLDANRVEIKDTKSLQSDGTHDTVSELVFAATRYENGESLTCEATNEVLLLHSEPPMRKTVALEVMYPPIVSVTPDNVTVNESTDILLFCQYEANPATLKSVKWRRDGEVVLLDRKDHYEGGTPDQTTLLIKNSTRHDHGMYTCELENGVGKGNSSNGVYVNIQFRPVVKLEMDPPTPVSELSKMNITLICRVEAGNPDTLQAVRWLLDGELLKELPDCNSTAMGDSFCDVDPSKLLLEAVERSFHGNYSCEGANEAGWGPVSDDTPLIVYYPPGPAELTHDVTVVKNSAITLSCAVSDLGRPPTTTFRWLRNSSPVNNVTSANWTINPVTLRTRSNFTCLAVNEGGEGESATAEINVLAPPSFIERLNPYEGAPFNATHINISCQVECQPLCDVNWLKNGQPVELSRGADMAMYSVRNVVVDPDYNRGDFDSIRSTLIWNMAAWPNGQLDRVHDNANYTCQSSGNPVGNGVKSTTIFGVEYPPENITVSKQVVSVVESRVPELVLCSARAYPEASYEWRAENSTDETSVVKRNKLILNKSMHRKDSGNWTCTAINRHGSISTTIRIDVQYKPECTIASEEVEGQLVLTCMVRANPDQVSFTWRIENSNETVEENVVSQGLRSRLTLDTRAEDTRTYLCYATNAVGTSFPCERGVQAHYKEKSSKLAAGNLSWWKRLENDNLMIIIAVVVSTIIMVLIICIIIILVCRRKRAADKYNNPVELEERQNYERFVANLYGQQLLYPEGDASAPAGAPDGKPDGAPSPGAPSPAESPALASPNARHQHKWPLKPGVMVHVNGAHSLSLSRLPDHLANNNNTSSVNNNCSSTPALNPAPPKKQKRRRRAGSLTTLQAQQAPPSMPDETNQHSRANRIRQMFSNCDQNGRNSYSSKRGDTLPGVFHSKSGVVTFKRLDESANPGGSRKRKKPGAGPNPAISKDKAKDRNNAPGDALLPADGDGKAFYENLPFHGIQNAPNKPYRPEFSDLDYADVDYRSYGPINYKAASILAAEHADDEPQNQYQQYQYPSGRLSLASWRPPPPPDEDYL